MDHDESTYLLIGASLTQEDQMYTDVIDTKPVGIFLIYALFHCLFGYSIFMTRLAVSVLVGVTAFLIYLCSLNLFKSKNSALASAIIYLFYTSLWTKFGASPNTELFFNLTTIGGFWFLLKNSKSSLLLASLIFGIGFLIKYLVLFDFVFLFGFFFIREIILYKKENGFDLLKYIFAGLGFSIPFLLTHLYFYFNGNFEDFKYITYVVPVKYSRSAPGIFSLNYLIFILDFLARFVPISVLFFVVFFSKNWVFKKWKFNMFLVWILGVLIAMSLPGQDFGHYSIQLMLPISLVAGLYFHISVHKNKLLSSFLKKHSLFVIAVFFLIVQAFGIGTKFSKEDKPEIIAQYLSDNMALDESLYLSDYKHIVYYLLKKKSPTKYVHPSLLTKPEYAAAFGIDGKDEIKRIINQKPDWVVLYNENTYVDSLIYHQSYTIDTLFFNGIVKVYRK